MPSMKKISVQMTSHCMLDTSSQNCYGFGETLDEKRYAKKEDSVKGTNVKTVSYVVKLFFMGIDAH